MWILTSATNKNHLRTYCRLKEHIKYIPCERREEEEEEDDAEEEEEDRNRL